MFIKSDILLLFMFLVLGSTQVCFPKEISYKDWVVASPIVRNIQGLGSYRKMGESCGSFSSRKDSEP